MKYPLLGLSQDTQTMYFKYRYTKNYRFMINAQREGITKWHISLMVQLRNNLENTNLYRQIENNFYVDLATEKVAPKWHELFKKVRQRLANSYGRTL